MHGVLDGTGNIMGHHVVLRVWVASTVEPEPALEKILHASSQYNCWCKQYYFGDRKIVVRSRCIAEELAENGTALYRSIQENIAQFQ